MDLEERAERLTNQAELVALLNGLVDSLVEQPEAWENRDLGSFLRAWAAWLADSDGYFRNRGLEPPREPTWSLVAQMLLAAKVYE